MIMLALIMLLAIASFRLGKSNLLIVGNMQERDHALSAAIQPIPVTALDFTNPQDAGCLIGASQNFGVAGSASNNSMCANSVWDTRASVNNAKYIVNEGTAVRVPSSTVCP
jgi:hypothetical protein